MNTELMYDATPGGVDAIPSDAKIVAGYVDGLYQSFLLLVRRFGGKAHIVSIGVWSGHHAEWTDVEPGNPINTPNLVREDFLRRRNLGIWKPGFYADLTRMRDTVLPGLTGIPRSEYRLWLADWDGNENFIPLPGGAEAAKQFRNAGAYDVSVVNVEAFLGPHHPTGHHPKPHDPQPAKHPAKHKHHRIPRPHKPRNPLHPKTGGAIGGGGLGAGIVAILVGVGAHITPTEAAGITTLIAGLLSYLFPGRS